MQNEEGLRLLRSAHEELVAANISLSWALVGIRDGRLRVPLSHLRLVAQDLGRAARLIRLCTMQNAKGKMQNEK